MEIASVVFKHSFDKSMLEQIDTLRTIQLTQAEAWLKNLDGVAMQLEERGLIEGGAGAVNRLELRRELEERCRTLRQRLSQPDVIYEDEISFYVDLLDQENTLGDALEDDDACSEDC